MRRATVRIVNRTQYPSAQLRAFVLHARDDVFGAERKPLVVTFLPSRRRIHGRATIGGSRSTVWLPPQLDREGYAPGRLALAQILRHEFAHNSGMKGERRMRGSAAYGFVDGWKQHVQWALDLPLERPAAPPVDPRATIEAELGSIERRRRAWITRAKRAATALRKLAQRETRLRRKLAATKEPQQ
jgi:hypothetical protein